MPQNPWDVPITQGQPQAQPQLDPGMMQKLIKSLFKREAPVQAAPPQEAAGPVFSGDALDELALVLKKQKQKQAILGGQVPPE